MFKLFLTNPIENIIFFLIVAAIGTLISKLFIELSIKIYERLTKNRKAQ